MKRWWLLSFQWLYCVYAYLLFIVLMLLIFPFVLGATLFGSIRGGNAVYRICTFWADVWFPLVFIWHKNSYEYGVKKDQAYIFVANHISYLDAALLPKIVRQPVRALGKVETAKVPIFGVIYKNAIVTVDRSSAANRANSVRLLKATLAKGISIFFFPEGTFNTTHQPLKEFYDGAFRIAIETGTPIKPVLFLDSYDRLHYDSPFSLTPGKSRAVYLEDIPVEGLTLSELPRLKAKVHRIMWEKLVEYKASWIKEAHESTR